MAMSPPSADRHPAHPPVVMPARCTGCGACIAACRPDAIVMAQEESGRKHAQIKKDRCQLAGDCVVACPHEAIFVLSWKVAREG